MYRPKDNFMTALCLAVLLLAVGTTAAIEVALLSEAVQDADAAGCQPGGTGFNASKGRCFHPTEITTEQR
jgi:hypothetical protein